MRLSILSTSRSEIADDLPDSHSGAAWTSAATSTPAQPQRSTSRTTISTNINSRLNSFNQGQPRFRGRVLLVDDSKDNQRVLSYHLKKFGLSVEFADNGLEAANRGASETFDLILMDLQMPLLDGYAATRRLRQLGYRRPIIALTAQIVAGDAEKCRAAGCDDFLRKPIELDRFVTVLSCYLKSNETESSFETEPFVEPRRAGRATDRSHRDSGEPSTKSQATGAGRLVIDED